MNYKFYLFSLLECYECYWAVPAFVLGTSIRDDCALSVVVTAFDTDFNGQILQWKSSRRFVVARQVQSSICLENEKIVSRQRSVTAPFEEDSEKLWPSRAET